MREEPSLKSSRRATHLRSTAAGIALLLLAPTLFAQAWLAPKGEASFGVAYQNIYTRDHIFSEGEVFDSGKIRMNMVVFGLTYSFTDRLQASASVPYVATRYDGTRPHVSQIDDGTYHGTFTDLRVDLRYNLLQEPAMVTPFVSAVIPTRDYPTFAHAAPSSGLERYLVGVSFGRRLDPILEAGFAQVRYSYAFQERVLGISHDRSNVDLEVGYFLTPSLGVSALGSYQKTHGGIELPVVGSPANDAFRRTPYFVHHDQLAQSNYWNVGGVVSYALTGTVDVFAAYQTTVWGRSIHATQPGLSFGVNWGFSPRRVIRSFVRKSAAGESAE